LYSPFLGHQLSEIPLNILSYTMRQSMLLIASATNALATSLSDICTTSHVMASLPADGTFNGITINSNSVSANAVYNESVSSGTFFPAATISYCNVTFQYTHSGLNDTVNLEYYLPSPSDFKNRFLATGGGGYAINSGSQSLPGGIMYGAAAGITDGGFGGFAKQFDSVVLRSNGTINWPAVFMFGYQGIHEMTKIGKVFANNFFSNANGTKIYTYYQGCSEGGREGWSQVQRAGEDYDGVIAGAPAFRYAQQQVQHLYSNVVEQTLNYYPPPCELAKIINETIAFCDPLDGKTDGVISRSDLCKLQFNINSTIGLPYFCAATSGSNMGGPGKAKRQAGGTGGPGGAGGPGGSSQTQPAQNGTVSEKGVAVAQTILDGLHDSQGRRAYLSYQPGASFVDAATVYDNTTNSWGPSIASTGGEFVAKFLKLLDEDNLSTLNGVTYDTLTDWMIQALAMYTDTLQTTLPDLTPFQSHGGKIIHFHGEQDDSVPTGSSVHYYESVRQIMYPNATYNASTAKLNDWYRLFLVPGAGHCGANSLQPNGPFPQMNLAVMIDWVENDVVPTTLNATVLQGDYVGRNEQICAWPLRPYWADNETITCQYDQASIDTWMYDFDAYKMPLY
jgi:tannase